MRYKNTGDICFEQFSRYCESIKDQEIDVIMAETMRVFFPKEKALSLDKLREFQSAMQIEPKEFPYLLNLDFKKAGDFIDADNLITNGRFLQFAKMFVKPKHRFQKVFLSVHVVNYALEKFNEIAKPIKSRYDWIYNPPQLYIPEVGKPDPKLEARNAVINEYKKEFVKHYGAYMEIIYLLTKGDFTKFDEITDWPLHQFLYQGEYLLRKRRIESLN